MGILGRILAGRHYNEWFGKGETGQTGQTPPAQTQSGQAPQPIPGVDAGLWEGWPNLPSEIGESAGKDYNRTWNAMQQNQQLARTQADKYIAESKAAREGRATDIQQTYMQNEADLNSMYQQAGMTRMGMANRGQEAADTLAGVGDWMWNQAQAGAGEVRNSINLARHIASGVYQEANMKFGELGKMREEALRSGRADIEGTIEKHSDYVAQSVSTATTQLKRQEEQQMQAVLAEAQRNGIPANDPSVQAELRQIKQANNETRAGLATQSFQEANRFVTELSGRMYTELGNQAASWGQTMAAAAETVAGVGKQLSQTFNITTEQLVSMNSQLNKVLSDIGTLRATGETLKQNYIVSGEQLAADMEQTALKEGTAMRHNYNTVMNQLEVIGTQMRDSEYNAYMDAYSQRVLPTFPMTATLWQMSTSEDQRKFENILATIDAVMGVLSFAFPGRLGGGRGGGGGSDAQEAAWISGGTNIFAEATGSMTDALFR